jgi:arginyl-tRNA synthetase
MIEEVLGEWLQAAYRKAFPEAAAEAVAILPTESEEHGDYQCNQAMALAKKLRRPPRQVAEALVAAAEPHPAVASLSVAGPGFLNIRLNDAWLAAHLAEAAADERCGVPDVGAGRTVVLDYSSPNVAKPMHIGHIRSTVIGNALDRMHRFLGYRVLADNHLGDWGTQFGIILMGYRNFLDPAALEASPVEELERLYVKSYERAQQDEAWMAAARQELVKLQAGDPENLALWRQFVQLSLGEFERLYRRLGVTFDLVRGESHYNDRLAGLVDDLKARGIVRQSEGAWVAFLEEEKLPPAIVQKTDGAFNYATTDVATVQSRVAEFAPHKIVYVTDERQQLHFRQVFAICRRLGVTTDLEHVWFGLMRLPQGTFSTRQGNVIKLELLLDEAEKRALAIVQASSPELPPEQQREIARAVGIGAVKYADLSQNPQSLVTFTWEKALAMDGNSAPYLQYACARISSVLDKYREQFPGRDFRTEPIRLAEPVERTLARHLARFPGAIVRAAETYKPSALADYLYELSGIYSRFYQNVPFLKAPEGVRESRVRLCAVTAAVLRKGLGLLGVETPERI